MPDASILTSGADWLWRRRYTHPWNPCCALPFRHEIANNDSIPVRRDPQPVTELPAVIERYCDIALFLLVLTGFSTLAATGQIDAVSVILIGAALLYRGILLVQNRTIVLSVQWTNVLTLLYGVFYLADYFLIAGSFLQPTVHLVLFLTVIRLFSLRRDRDRYFLAIIAFLMVLSAAVLTVDSMFLVAFSVFLLTAVANVILLEMRNASGKADLQANETKDQEISRRLALSLTGITPGLVLLIMAGTAAIFFVLPRASAGYLTAFSPNGEVATGFSDRVDLGRIGEIQQSSSVVMHIKVDGDRRTALGLRWRGVALGEFDGKSWYDNHEQWRVHRGFGNQFPLYQSIRQALPPLHYRVLMEPIGSNIFFLAPTPLRLQGAYTEIATNRGGAVFNLDPAHPVGVYEAWSDISQPTPDEARAATEEYPPAVPPGYLRHPKLDPRIAALANQITAGATTNYDKAVALENYLQTHFGYTLQLPRTVPTDPLANFLFERKQGHCEYFASSMAIMLRTLNIPSRVVNGFRTTEFNDVTSQYLVRASSAHSWVEAYFPGVGWMTFDPTPASGFIGHTGLSRTMLYLDALASFWREWVINYDVGRQYSLSREANRETRQLSWVVRHWAMQKYRACLRVARRVHRSVTESPGTWVMGVGLVLIVLVLVVSAPWIWRTLARRRAAAHPQSAPALAASIWYERMVHRLARAGWKKSSAQTPGEFAESIANSLTRRRVEEFTQHYEKARFGESASDAEQLPELYEGVVGSTKR